MSWSRRGAVLGLLGLAGCGFAPVHAPGGAADGLRGAVAVDPPRDEAGYELVKQLETRLGLPAAPRYRLAAELALGREGLGLTPGRDITRYQVRGAVDWRLIEIAGGAVAASGTVSAFTGYSAPVFDDTRGAIAGNTVSVETAERDAERRLMVILADRLVSRLLVAGAGA